MAAIHPDTVRRSKTRASTQAVARSPIARAVCAAVAFVCMAAGLALTRGYPITPMLVAAAFIAWTVFATWRFSWALPALFSLVPVMGFATWTGWLTFEETDLLVLASAAGGYAARAMAIDPVSDGSARRYAPRLSIFAIGLLALFFVSTVISLERGVLAAGGWHFSFFDSYDGALNSLRIFKSFAFALLLAPLVVAELRNPGGPDRIGLGLTTALALAALSVLHERLAFTGLLEFSDDYRVTGPFWEMHIGGAALDGFLALTIPFAIREAIRHASPARFVAAMAVLALAAYACLVTFSRGVYVALPISMFVLAALLVRQRVKPDRVASWGLIGKGVALTLLVAFAGFFVFRHGGYRATLAMFAVFALAIIAETTMRRASTITWGASVICAVPLVAFGYLVAAVLPKGPYLLFAAIFFAMIAAIAHDERKPTTVSALAFVVGWLWLAAAAVQVAGFWGGPPARDDSFIVSCSMIVALFAVSRRSSPLWPPRRRERLATIGFAALVLASVAVFVAGAYMGGRFATSNADLDTRLAHWKEGIGRLHDSDWLIGKGLGRFPATSIFEASDGTSPGRFGVSSRNGETFMTIVGTQKRYIGFDEMFRVSQRVSIQPHTLYTAVIRARAELGTGFHIELCEKQLLYQIGCRVTDLGIAASGQQWQTLTFRFDSGEMGAPHWFGKRAAFFAVGVGEPGRIVDVQSMHIFGPDRTDLLANGDFSDHTSRWFTQSDKFHLPWHIKNIALDLLFDQGAIGLALFGLLAGGSWIRTALGRARRHPDAPYVAAAIAGYLVVGAFDSLLDVPRVAFLFYNVVIVGLALRNPRVAPPQVAAAPPAVPAIDEAAARALRRQQAFGERRPSSSTRASAQ